MVPSYSKAVFAWICPTYDVGHGHDKSTLHATLAGNGNGGTTRRGNFKAGTINRYAGRARREGLTARAPTMRWQIQF